MVNIDARRDGVSQKVSTKLSSKIPSLLDNSYKLPTGFPETVRTLHYISLRHIETGHVCVKERFRSEFYKISMMIFTRLSIFIQKYINLAC